MGFSRFLQSLKTASPGKDAAFQVTIREVEKPSSASSSSSSTVSTHQRALILYAPRQPYEEIPDHPTPSLLNTRELLVRNKVIGLNPIDWKAPDFNFGIPELPYVSGRELVGQVAISPRHKSRFRPGDWVIVISTDYRDLRKAAYQQCVVATDFNVCRLPPNVSPESGSALGVAFVAAALCLGICAGLDFTKLADGPDLLSIVRRLDPQRLPQDVRPECLEGINLRERAKAGDWVAIWGGSSTSALMLNQIARLLGLRTISVLDHSKHALNLTSNPHTRPDVIVDNHNPGRAVEIVRSVTNNRLRFAVDTVGRETATHLMQCLGQGSSSLADSRSSSNGALPPSTLGTDAALPASIPSTDGALPRAHLVGLTGLPKTKSSPDITFHTMPIKVFHEIPEVGEALMLWLERLLSQGLLVPPPILGVREGFGAINGALDSMRRGEISGGRLVVKVE
ncbi:oxidoreductase, zinc-binding dehydrogenase [Cladophialophora carrionii]|uniref:Oxidoreductase, zinc-binding dehydrogenase n=1 Tax=Cladophialophora carrionii TaxID=86049 RepID=A0A1C1CTF4_9EURO|nr:oxidoreductase, zinc-binding dehydrogenase [Cladophialophora carrionii]